MVPPTPSLAKDGLGIEVDCHEARGVNEFLDPGLSC